jgi:hypothetical protein
MQLLITVVWIALTAAASPRESGITQVTLLLDGVHTDADGRVIGEALSKIPNIKVATRATAKKPEVVVVPLAGATYDLGDLAKTVAKTETPNRAKGALSAALVLVYKLRDGTTADELAKDFKPACAKLKGVVAEKCRLDPDAKKLYIRLSDDGGAKLAEIKAAFPGLTLSPD